LSNKARFVNGAYGRPASKDRQYPGEGRVEWFDHDGGSELAISAGPNARERAIIFADRC
jgi:hypothetical protein